MGFIRTIRTILRAMWKSLGFLMFIIGLLYLWPDIQGLPEIYPKFFGWFPMVERETITFILLGIAILWIIWIDARPLVKSLILQYRKLPLDITFANIVNSNYVFGAPIIRAEWFVTADGSKASMVCRNFYIPVENKTEKTIDNVKVILHSGGLPVTNFSLTLPHESGNDSISISPGQIEFFFLGRSCRDGTYPVTPNTSLSGTIINETIEKHKNWGLIIPSSGNRPEITFFRSKDQKLLIQVIGRDIAPIYSRFRLDGNDKTKLYLLEPPTKIPWNLQHAYDSTPEPKLPEPDYRDNSLILEDE